MSAFANTAGGVLAFGIDDAHEVLGLADAQADADFISEKIKECIEPLPRFEIEATRESGRDVLLVRVRAEAHPPYYYSADGRREAYVRVGNQSVIAPQDAFWVTLWNMNYVEGSAASQVGTQDGTQDGAQVGDQVSAVLKALGDAEMTSTELMTALGFSARSKFQQNYLKPALESGLVVMTIPGKPNSRNQKYRRAK